MVILFCALLAGATAIQLPALIRKRDKKQIVLYILFMLGAAAEGFFIKAV